MRMADLEALRFCWCTWGPRHLRSTARSPRVSKIIKVSVRELRNNAGKLLLPSEGFLRQPEGRVMSHLSAIWRLHSASVIPLPLQGLVQLLDLLILWLDVWLGVGVRKNSDDSWLIGRALSTLGAGWVKRSDEAASVQTVALLGWMTT